MITQHINTTMANGVALTQIVVRVNFSLNGCLTGGSCLQSFGLRIYETPNIDTNGSLNTANYASFPSNLVTVVSNPTGSVVELADVTVPLALSNGGVYLSAQDFGTCVSISRLVVFYYACPQQVVDFISYPQSASNGPITQLQCTSGASVVGPGQLLASCGSLGMWGPAIGSCLCSPGYTNTSVKTCQGSS